MQLMAKSGFRLVLFKDENIKHKEVKNFTFMILWKLRMNEISVRLERPFADI